MRLLLISSSVVHGYGYLDHAEPFLRDFLGPARRIAFIPYAAHDHRAYTAKVRERFGRMEMEVTDDGVERADAVFVGGGNTFRLLKTLQERGMIALLRECVRDGLPYVGSSAGSVITAPTIRSTNDMPIVECATLDALGLIPFQINGHYLDPDPASTHKGETREERLREYHEENFLPVVGLREGTMLRVENGVLTLLGEKPARIFRRGQEPVECQPGPLSGLL
jgi:dipeptidase E